MQPYDWPLDQLKQYVPPLTIPEDFRDFWRETLAELDTISMSSQRQLMDYPAHNIVLYRVSFSGFNNQRLGGWFASPRTTQSVPGLLVLPGYNWNYHGSLHDIANWALHGYAVLGLAIPGQPNSEGQSIFYTGGSVAGWMTQGILDPHTYYYRSVYANVVRAIQWLKVQDEVDPAYIGVTGGSQGGGLTLAALALSSIPVVGVAEYPFLCGFRRGIDVAPAGPYGEFVEFFRQHPDPAIESQVFRTLDYFDVTHLAPMINQPVLVSVGLLDQITPPSTIFGTFNRIGSTAKSLRVYRFFEHKTIPQFHSERLRWFQHVLKEHRAIDELLPDNKD